MKIKLLMIGKTADNSLAALIDEYDSRLKYYVSFEQLIIPALKNVKKISVDEQKEKEAALLLAKIDDSEDIILLDERGDQFASAKFADFLSKRMLNSSRNLVFVIGGPYGFSQKMYEKAKFLLSLSAMTFSHQMIRLLFVEQLYRAMTIIKGEPYHHE